MRTARLACQGAGGQASWYAAATKPEVAARNAARSAQAGIAGKIRPLMTASIQFAWISAPVTNPTGVSWRSASTPLPAALSLQPDPTTTGQPCRYCRAATGSRSKSWIGRTSGKNALPPGAGRLRFAGNRIGHTVGEGGRRTVCGGVLAEHFFDGGKCARGFLRAGLSDRFLLLLVPQF